MTMAERKSNIRLTKNTPYLALTGELCDVFCEDFGENWPRYKAPHVFLLSVPNACLSNLEICFVETFDSKAAVMSDG